MNNEIKEKKIILGEIDIQPLINMKSLLINFLANEDIHEVDEKTAMACVQAFEVAYELS